jgi:hypothetical protein
VDPATELWGHYEAPSTLLHDGRTLYVVGATAYLGLPSTPVVRHYSGWTSMPRRGDHAATLLPSGASPVDRRPLRGRHRRGHPRDPRAVGQRRDRPGERKHRGHRALGSRAPLSHCHPARQWPGAHRRRAEPFRRGQPGFRALRPGHPDPLVGPGDPARSSRPHGHPPCRVATCSSWAAARSASSSAMRARRGSSSRPVSSGPHGLGTPPRSSPTGKS